MTIDPITELRETLAEFEAWLAEHGPDVLARLRPGLSDDQIAERERELAPFHLPADLVELYRWRDGFVHYAPDWVSLLIDCEFLSLDEALDEYRFHNELADAEPEIPWHPLWFPAFGGKHGELVELQTETGRVAPVLWSFHSEGRSLHASYDSIAAMFLSALAVWQVCGQPGMDITDEAWTLVRDANPRTSGARGSVEVDMFATHDWPEEWRQVLDIQPMEPTDSGLLVTVAEFVGNPRCGRPVRGVLTCEGGSSEGWSVWQLEDETDHMRVSIVIGETENAREMAPGELFDVYAVPDPTGKDIPELDDEALAALSDENRIAYRILSQMTAPYVATRIVPVRGGGI